MELIKSNKQLTRHATLIRLFRHSLYPIKFICRTRKVKRRYNLVITTSSLITRGRIERVLTKRRNYELIFNIRKGSTNPINVAMGFRTQFIHRSRGFGYSIHIKGDKLENSVSLIKNFFFPISLIQVPLMTSVYAKFGFKPIFLLSEKNTKDSEKIDKFNFDNKVNLIPIEKADLMINLAQMPFNDYSYSIIVEIYKINILLSLLNIYKESLNMLIKDNNLIITIYRKRFNGKRRDVFVSGVSKKPVDVRGRNSLRSRRGKQLKKHIKYLSFHSTTRVGLISNIFFNKRVFKLFSFIKLYGKKGNSSFAMQSTSRTKLFSYYKLHKDISLLKEGGFSVDSLLKYLKHQIVISNLELFFGNGRKYIKASGCQGSIVSVNIAKQVAQIKLPSTEVKVFSADASCSVGSVALKEKKKIVKGDWRYKRLKGFSPVVRGIAMNPIDHPHGGKKKSVRFPKNPWGLAAKIK